MDNVLDDVAKVVPGSAMGVAKFGENSNSIRETDANVGSKAGCEPSAHFPGSQSLVAFVYFERCFSYERTASTCGCAKDGHHPPAFGPAACFARRRLRISVLGSIARDSTYHDGLLALWRGR